MDLTDFFRSKNIELYGAVDFQNIKVIDSRKLERHPDFSPKSALIVAIPYFVGSRPENQNISDYAVPRDYHLYFKELFHELIKFLTELFPHNRFLPFADSSPIDERYAGAVSGLGVIGKNGLLITKKYGSYVFLGEVISDLDCSCYFGHEPVVHEIGSCMECGICQKKCPREKIGMCLSELTQKKGTLTHEEASYLIQYDTAWGCDICQSVCPHNIKTEPTPIDFFKESTCISWGGNN